MSGKKGVAALREFYSTKQNQPILLHELPQKQKWFFECQCPLDAILMCVIINVSVIYHHLFHPLLARGVLIGKRSSMRLLLTGPAENLLI